MRKEDVVRMKIMMNKGWMATIHFITPVYQPLYYGNHFWNNVISFVRRFQKSVSEEVFVSGVVSHKIGEGEPVQFIELDE